MVMENNDQIRADRYAEQASIKQKKAAVGLRSPQLSLSAGYAFMSDDIAVDMNGLKAPVGGALGQLGLPIPPALTGQLMAADWSLPLQERDFAVVGATLKVPIYTGGKINAANRAARIGVEQSRWQQRPLYHSRRTLLRPFAGYARGGCAPSGGGGHEKTSRRCHKARRERYDSPRRASVCRDETLGGAGGAG